MVKKYKYNIELIDILKFFEEKKLKSSNYIKNKKKRELNIYLKR